MLKNKKDAAGSVSTTDEQDFLSQLFREDDLEPREIMSLLTAKMDRKIDSTFAKVKPLSKRT